MSLALEVRRRAGVIEEALAPMRTAPHMERATAVSTDCEGGQEILRVHVTRGPAPHLPAVDTEVTRAGLFESALHGGPQLMGDDAEGRGLEPDPVRRVALRMALASEGIALLRAIPDDHAPVKLSIENLAYARWRPAGETPGASRRRRERALVIERVRDGGIADAFGVEREDPPDHRRLRLMHAPLDMEPSSIGRTRFRGRIAEDAPTDGMARLRLVAHRVMGADAALALHRGETHPELHHRDGEGIVHLDFPRLVADDAHACARQLEKRRRRLLLVTAETGLLHHEEHLERRVRLQRVQEARAPRSLSWSAPETASST
ncbi:MAG TPA: hypothetical protein VL287_08810 [Gemmatimonadales bacterium]|nr:hypothetical protein [Gemmatimonadales bacterium]